MTKKQYLKELKNIINRAMKDVDILTKKSKFKIFDHRPSYSVYSGKLITPETDEMDSEDIFYEMVANYPIIPELFLYTEKELDNIKKNDSEEKIKAYEESILAHQSSIDSYKKLINNIRENKH